MNDRETARYNMFGRVATFGSDHAGDFAPASKAAGHFATLAGVIRDLDQAKAAQTGGSVTAKTVLLDALRIDLRNIRRTAAAIDQDEPGFADRFPAPANSNPAALLTAADTILAELAKPGVAARFIANELPADFVQDLADDRAAIGAAEDEVESADSEGVASTAAVGRLIRTGMKEVNYLNAILHNKYTRDPDTLRAWKSASHIERAAKRENKSASGASGTAPKPNT